MTDDLPISLVFVIGFCLGAIIGSFLGAAYYRIPRKISLTKTTDRSACPSCDEELKISDNIPIAAWLFLRGKCRYCNQNISIKYFLFELGVALLAGFGLVYYPLVTFVALTLAIIVPSIISYLTAKD